jgi:hypothetical protein
VGLAASLRKRLASESLSHFPATLSGIMNVAFRVDFAFCGIFL